MGLPPLENSLSKLISDMKTWPCLNLEFYKPYLKVINKLITTPRPTGSSEVQMNGDFNDFESDDSVADKDYVPSATSSSESELDVGGNSDSESDILNAENSDTEVENTHAFDRASELPSKAFRSQGKQPKLE
ncbi:hypothetical protein FQA39_LY14972 [Lamprigera yunnana]|nr:hypothetical protein FQA39_LY14972 [Lamprigera yunnana]